MREDVVGVVWYRERSQVCYVRFYGKVKMAAAKMTVIAPLFSS